MSKCIRKATSLIITLAILWQAACSTAPTVPGTGITTGQTEKTYVRQLQTTPYVGNKNAVIFTMAHAADSSLNDTSDRIIRIFSEHNIPLDVALLPSPNADYSSLIYLRHYVNAGLIDISINGESFGWLDEGTTNGNPAYAALQSQLSKTMTQVGDFFGDQPNACMVPFDHVNENNYAALQDSGYKILTTSYSADFNTTNEPLLWSGEADKNGLYRLPIMGTVDYSLESNARMTASKRMESDAFLLTEIGRGLDNPGMAAVLILPSLFTGQDSRPDDAKLSKLASLVESCRHLGEITTFKNWSSYMSRWAPGNSDRLRVMPAYNGGPAIIFRMDDVSVGWHEDVVEAIIKLFENNGVPVDLGIVSNVDGTDSYQIPWIQGYLDRGMVGISVHGYDWTYYQFDTTQDMQSRQLIVTDSCNLPGTAQQPEIPEERLTYAYLKFKLMKARDQYLQYFGVKPVALTVPTDFYDETGYRAIQDAGFEIFATQVTAEPHPSIVKVDFNGVKNSDGMYRIPTATDVCVWDNCTWGDVFDIGDIMAITDYCKYHAAWNQVSYNDFGAMLCGTLKYLGVAAVGIHPDAFVGIDGKPDQAKLDKLDIIIKYCKTVATITTFEQWCNFTRANK